MPDNFLIDNGQSKLAVLCSFLAYVCHASARFCCTSTYVDSDLPERLKEFIGVEENWKSVIFNMKQTSNSGRFIQSNQNKKKRQKIGLAG